MKIFYPYPENLPNYRAHDVYVFRNCASLARYHDVTLCIGNDTLSDEALKAHYHTSNVPTVLRIPILRRNNLFRLSWKRPFYWKTQKLIERKKPDIVMASVLAQGLYHWKRKVPGVRYFYEVHELSCYPNHPCDAKMLKREREMLQASDKVIVTTPPLKKILKEAPYNLSVPIEVVPLGVGASPLPPPSHQGQGGPIRVAYVGQCYPLQGVELILDGLKYVPQTHLEIVGGLPKGLERLKAYAKNIQVEEQVTFHGVQPPSRLENILEKVDGFVMPSRHLTHNPYVAYTKLYEYASWGRPLIAPNCKAVLDHLGSPKGILFYQPEDPKDLALCLEHLSHLNLVKRLGEEMGGHAGNFSWEKRAERYNFSLSAL